jgi:ketosteroid isomerase-like protein
MKAESLQLQLPDDATGLTPASFPQIQTEFVKAAGEDFAKAIRKFGSDDVRIYRDGKLPAVGQKAAIQVVSAQPGNLNMEILHTDISSSGDLAYHYGKYSSANSSPAAQGYFLQIWRTNPTGRWSLVLDWQQPLPPPK